MSCANAIAGMQQSARPSIPFILESPDNLLSGQEIISNVCKWGSQSNPIRMRGNDAYAVESPSSVRIRFAEMPAMLLGMGVTDKHRR